MANIKLTNLVVLLLFNFILLVPGLRTEELLTPYQERTTPTDTEPQLRVRNITAAADRLIVNSKTEYESVYYIQKHVKISRNSRRLMIGSTAPTCTYNECRGCKYKCRAEQVPVEGNDPINSAYHYKCVCHR